MTTDPRDRLAALLRTLRGQLDRSKECRSCSALGTVGEACEEHSAPYVTLNAIEDLLASPRGSGEAPAGEAVPSIKEIERLVTDLLEADAVLAVALANGYRDRLRAHVKEVGNRRTALLEAIRALAPSGSSTEPVYEDDCDQGAAGMHATTCCIRWGCVNAPLVKQPPHGFWICPKCGVSYGLQDDPSSAEPVYPRPEEWLESVIQSGALDTFTMAVPALNDLERGYRDGWEDSRESLIAILRERAASAPPALSVQPQPEMCVLCHKQAAVLCKDCGPALGVQGLAGGPLKEQT